MNRLTYKNGPRRHLLKTLPARAAKETERSGATRKTGPKRASPGITDAPLSSDEDDEDDDGALPEPQGRVSQRDKGLSTAAASSSSSPRRGARKNGIWSSSPKRPAEDMDDGFDMFGSSQSQKRGKKMKSYGAGGRAASIATAPTSRKNGTDDSRDQKALTPRKASKGKGAKKFKKPVLEQDLEESLRNLEDNDPPTKFKNPNLLYDVSKPIEENMFKVPLYLPDDDPPESSEPQQRRSKRGAGKAKEEAMEDVKIPRFDLTSGSTDDAAPTSSATTDFSASSAFLDMTLSSDSSPLSTPPESPVMEPLVISEDLCVCPMCKQPVEAKMYGLLSSKGRMSVRKQAEFCRKHKLKSASREWKSRGYPEIEWGGLPRRIQSFQDQMRGILKRESRSVYREAMEEGMKSGKNRTLKQSLMSGGGFQGMEVGYYGPRGAQIFEESILSRFSKEIRELAPTDNVIASRGVSNYVQGVLIPELAVLLVKEDMGVDDERARVIIRESGEMGDLLYDDE